MSSSEFDADLQSLLDEEAIRSDTSQLAKTIAEILPTLEGAGVVFPEMEVIKPNNQLGDITDKEELESLTINAMRLIALAATVNIARLPGDNGDNSKHKKRLMIEAMYSDDGPAWLTAISRHMPGEDFDQNTDAQLVGEVMAESISFGLEHEKTTADFIEQAFLHLAQEGAVEIGSQEMITLQLLSAILAESKLPHSSALARREKAQLTILHSGHMSPPWIGVLDRFFPV